MPDVVTVGELLVEIMRKEVGAPLDVPGDFAGPFPSGAPAIFIDTAARLGASVGLVAAAGPDDFGKCCIGRLIADGVDVSQVKTVEGHTTGCAFVTYFHDGSRKFIFHLPHSAAARVTPEDLDEDWLKTARLIHICGSSLSVGDDMRESCYRAVSVVKSAGGMVSFDPNLRPELLGVERVREISKPVLEAADIVLPSGSEAMLLTGSDSPENGCRIMIEQGASAVALKQGSHGCTVFTSQDIVHVPGYKVKAVDPTGAGDSFDAAFCVAWLEGRDVDEAGRFANAAGALAATKLGPMEGAPYREMVEEMAG